MLEGAGPVGGGRGRPCQTHRVGRPETLSPDRARAMALAAQGFRRAPPAPPRPGTRALLGEVRRLGLLQVDSVNVLARAHYLPLFSRLGGYDRDLLDRLSGRAPRRLFEYWGHEASLIPVETQPLLRWRMAEGHAWSGPRRVAQEQPQLIAEVLAAVGDLGPVTSAQLERSLEGEHRRSRDYQWGWNWSDAKRALEYLFGCGEISCAGRDATFTRLYDVTERVIPVHVLRRPTPDRADSIRALVDRACRAMGVATEADLRDYWRLPLAETRAAIAELVADAVLIPAAVAGWPLAWRHRDAAVPRSAHGDGLIAPFDPLIWNRARALRVFGMRYRIEIYVPAAKREFGYYVLPFLSRGRLVARLDLKADRAAGRLLVRGAWAQRPMLAEGSGSTIAPPASELAAEVGRHLESLAAWLGLGSVSVGDRGDLAPVLQRTH